jgi:hypothetical protein
VTHVLVSKWPKRPLRGFGLRSERAPYVSIPLNTVIKLTPDTYGCDEERYLLLSKDLGSDGQAEPHGSADEPPSH